MISLLLGHYVSDGVYSEADVDDPSDLWLTYNDSLVTQTTGASVCEQRQQTAYILFYQRRVRGFTHHPEVKLTQVFYILPVYPEVTCSCTEGFFLCTDCRHFVSVLGCRLRDFKWLAP